MTKSLGDYIVDRTESLDEELIKQFFVNRNDNKIARLLDSEQYLLEGSRGIGKTMLMKIAALKAQEEFEKNSILAVWVSFEESIRIERIKISDSSLDPFLQWTMGKILSEILKQIIKLKPTNIDLLTTRLSKIFGNKNDNSKYEHYSKLLDEYIQVLEKGDVKDTRSLSTNIPSIELVKILDNPTSFKAFLLNLIQDFELKRIVLLFDEAAHVFSISQQEKFFTFFKSLRHPNIACKAAVYPGVTNYGKYFEAGQDAKQLKIDWKPTNVEDRDYIKSILKKRIQQFSYDFWNKLTLNPGIIDLICICSNGNPRFAFHIIDDMQNSGIFNRKIIQMKQVINSLRSVMDSKWKDFDTLKQRLVKYEQHIIVAEDIIKNIFLPNLRLWNDKRRISNSKLSAGFYIETSFHEKISQVFDVLAYANIIIFDNSKKSIGHKQYGYYISINPSLLFTDLILRDVIEIDYISTETKTNQSYYITTIELKEIVNNLKVGDEYHCSNEKCDFITNNESFNFCPKCGNKMELSEPKSLYKILRGHSINNLKLSDKIINRLKEKFNNIGEIYDADIEDIRMKYIQDVRVELVKNAAIEYMAG